MALAAAVRARYPLHKIGRAIVEELANCSCSVCLDMLQTRFGPLLGFSFHSAYSIFVYGKMTSH